LPHYSLRVRPAALVQVEMPPKEAGNESAGSGDAPGTFRHVFTKEHGKEGGKLEEFYKTEKKEKGALLGEGSYGQVTKATQKDSGKIVAVKAIDTSKVADIDKFKAEVEIQKQLDHPNIVKLFETFQDAKRYYLVMELCTGGELFDRIVEEAEKHADEGKEGEAFEEGDAANYMAQILGAMQYMHSRDFVHRDIKPENFLLASKERDAPIKVIDFGLAKEFKVGSDGFMKTKAGTPYYVAPQVLQGKYNEKCDIWSCGVIAYILLCGYPPFYGDRDEDILRRVKKGDFDFPSPDWDNVSSHGKDMIKSMLTLKQDDRPSAKSLLDHTWLQNNTERPKVSLSTDHFKKMQQFVGNSKVKKVALTYIAQQLDEKSIENLRQAFQNLDVNRDGTLTIKEITDGIQDGAKLSAEQLERLKKLDTDGSGSIDYTEFIAATINTKKYMKKEVMWSAFRLFDKDNDGHITKAELKTVLEEQQGGLMSEAEVDAIMTEIDTNGDGKISFSEFERMMDDTNPGPKTVNL